MTFIKNEDAYYAAIRSRIAAGTWSKWMTFIADHSDIDWEAVEKGNDFLRGLWESGVKYGKLSEKQVACIVDAQSKREERKTAREAAKAAEVAAFLESGVVVPTGRSTVTGEVVSVKEYESDYGITTKLLVLDERGFKVWVSSPTIKVACPHAEGERHWGLCTYDKNGVRWMNAQAGLNDVISFDALLEPTGDPMFVEASRPTKAKMLVEAAPVEEVEAWVVTPEFSYVPHFGGER